MYILKKINVITYNLYDTEYQTNPTFEGFRESMNIGIAYIEGTYRDPYGQGYYNLEICNVKNVLKEFRKDSVLDFNIGDEFEVELEMIGDKINIQPAHFIIIKKVLRKCDKNQFDRKPLITDDWDFPNLLKSSFSKEFELKITKELFIETIEAIKKQYDIDRKCAEAFRVILPNDYISCYDTNTVMNQLIKMLITATNDHQKHGSIEWFIWELEFGSRYKKGMLTIQEKDIPCATIEDLWNLLLLENKIISVDEIEEAKEPVQASDEILPCPFCNSEARISTTTFGDSTTEFYRIQCKNEHSLDNWSETESEAISYWNQRK